MSSPRKATAEPGKGQQEGASTTEDLNSWMHLPSSSQETAHRSVTNEVFANQINLDNVLFSFSDYKHSDFVDLFQESTESENEHGMWTADDDYLRDKWISDDELAGPSHAVPPTGHGIQIISERDLAQLALIRPLKFSFHEQSDIKNDFQILQKRIEEQEIIQEYMALDNKNMHYEFNCGNELCNRDKNRYRDILPYDSTRVPLGENKDYINASYIRITNSGEEYFYIATQGPLPTTTDDFWQMILENNSNVIVMITREIEAGVPKCHRYWPISTKKPLELKHCRVFLEDYQILPYFTIRIFQVVRKSTRTRHFIKQLQFTNWPDHGTPAPPECFIQYVRYVRSSHLTGPIVVHCSAGVGRTGVFICMDVVFCAIEKNFAFNIKDIVAQMRAQRYGMVQTKEQYWFCYKIVLEVLRKLATLDLERLKLHHT
ncbi:tyrosine-protein phosphatase non-receptor type 20 isoform X2 [Myotis myotis]|uniref:tyrosine-protein phosphatase non-receptor type 20 isoform X2 n=1 Tax=Myotis myotis TaxID=51298 RepID=UPI00174A23DF|nr:tyrosine-protein phosphatase non-receptor type 20 isoform X2 [Myotis myotis]